MAHDVTLPDGSTVSFPDEMADADIANVLKQHLNPVSHAAAATATGINQGIAGVFGAPVDLAAGGLNAAARGADWLGEKAGVPLNLGQINAPLGGSQSIAHGLASLVGETPAVGNAERYLQAGGRGVGGTAGGILTGGALNAAQLTPMLARALGGGADTLKTALTNLFAGGAAGVGQQGGKEAVGAFTNNPLAQEAGGLVGGLGLGVAAGYAPTAATGVWNRYLAPTEARATNAIRGAFNQGVEGGAPDLPATREFLNQPDTVAAGMTPKPLAFADVQNAPVQALAEQAAQTPGTASQVARSFLQQRDAGAGPRLVTDLEENLASGPTAYRTAQAVSVQRAADAAPLYQKAFEGGSIAPLEDTLTSHFNEMSSAAQQAVRQVAAAQQAVTAAQAKSAVAGNVYSSSAASTDLQAATAQLAKAQQAAQLAEQNKANGLDVLRIAQEHATNGVPGAVWTPRIQQFLEDPVIQQGISKGIAVQRLESLAAGKPFDPREYAITGFGQTGDPIVSKVPNMRLLDAAKRGLDDILEQYRDPTSGVLRLDQYGRAVDQVRKSFLGELDRVNPDYATARAAWSGPSQSLSAMKQGAGIFNMQPEQVSDIVGGLAPGDKDFFLRGARDALAQRVARTSQGGDEALRIVGNNQVQNQLRPLFDTDQQFNAFINQAKLESLMYNTKFQNLGGSQTFRRLAGASGGEGGGLASNALTAIGAAAAHEPVVSAMATTRILGKILSGMTGMTPAVRAQVANKLFTDDPAALQKILGEIAPNANGAPFALAPPLYAGVPLLPGERRRNN